MNKNVTILIGIILVLAFIAFVIEPWGDLPDQGVEPLNFVPIEGDYPESVNYPFLASPDNEKWWIPGWGAGTSYSTNSMTAGNVYVFPIFVDKERTYTEIGVRGGPNSPAPNTEFRIALYEWDNGVIGNLIEDFGAFTLVNTVTEHRLVINITLSRGYYFVASTVQTTNSFDGLNPNQVWKSPINGYQQGSLGASFTSYIFTGHTDAITNGFPINLVSSANDFLGNPARVSIFFRSDT